MRDTNHRLRLLIVDDNRRFRQEMAALLGTEPHIEVVGMAQDGREAIALAERLRPDVVLMDQNMPALTGIDATRRIKQTQPGVRVLFVAAEPAWRWEALRAGAAGYYVKGTDLAALLDALRTWQQAPDQRAWPARPEGAPARPRSNRLTLAGSVFVTAPFLLLIAMVAFPKALLPSVALSFGLLFFLYALKYYLSAGLILWANGGNGRNGSGERKASLANGLTDFGDLHLVYARLKRSPFVSIHLPVYNEPEVVDRLLKACTSLDYENYEVIVADDSTDQTAEILQRRWASHPRVKISHRENRRGFKGGALQGALQRTDPRADFIAVFDADFIPPPDILQQFLAYFYGVNGHPNGNGNGEGNGPGMRGSNGENGELRLIDDRVAVVQGYQWHILNASENWITRSIRTEFSGSYVVERSVQELTGGIKMVSGSVFMIRAGVLRKYGWSTSITEDWELTLRLYRDGYKVLYAPYIQAPSECVADFKQLSRQRMRWAEGHTYNVRRYWRSILGSPHLSLREKLEFVYYAPYYLQSAFFVVGTACWLLSELVLRRTVPFWSSALGWSLVFSNTLSLGLMNLTGLFLERGLGRGWRGLPSFLLLSYLLAPYQAFAAIKGLLDPSEGGWHRTLKTGVITERVEKLRFRRKWKGLRPRADGRGERPLDLKERLGPGSAVRAAQPREGVARLAHAGAVDDQADAARAAETPRRPTRPASRIVHSMGVALRSGLRRTLPRPAGMLLAPVALALGGAALLVARLQAALEGGFASLPLLLGGSVLAPLALGAVFARRARRLATLLIVLLSVLISQLALLSSTVEARALYGPLDREGYAERLDLRTETTLIKQRFFNGRPTNRFHLEASPGPVHYEDATGTLRDISTTILPSARHIPGFGDSAWEMTENDYELFVRGELNSGMPLIRYVGKNTDYYVQFVPGALRWANDLGQAEVIASPARVATRAQGSEVRWANAYGAGTLLRYLAGMGSLRKLLELNQPLPAPPQTILERGSPAFEYVESFSHHPDLSVWVNGREWNGEDAMTGESVLFRDPSGKVVFRFLVPYAFDAQGDEVSGQLRLRREGENLLVATRLPLVWLQSAAYPVSIDPIIDRQVSAGADDTSLQDDSFVTTYTKSLVGKSGLKVWHSSFRFTNITIANNYQIDVAYISFFEDGSGSTSQLSTRIDLEDADNPTAPTSAADFNSRQMTGFYTSYSDPPVPFDNWVNSPYIVSAVQDVVSRPGWASGNAMQVFWKNWVSANGHWYGFRMYEYSGNTYGVKLHIEYTEQEIPEGALILALIAPLLPAAAGLFGSRRRPLSGRPRSGRGMAQPSLSTALPSQAASLPVPRPASAPLPLRTARPEPARPDLRRAGPAKGHWKRQP